MDLGVSEVDNVAMKLFRHIVIDEWGLTERNANLLLTDIDIETNELPIEHGCLTDIQRERVSMIVGIYKTLNILFVKPIQAKDWIFKPNAAFDGVSALDVMLSQRQTGLKRVHQYLMLQDF